METILFLIVIGILSSVFGKAKGSGKTSENKGFPAKSFDEFRKIFEQQEMNNQSNIPEQISTKNQVVQEYDLQDIENKYEQIKQETRRDRVEKTHSQHVRKVNDPQHLSEKETEVFSVTPDEKTLINGIIWSEILGPPRSKRPYTARKY